MENGRRNLHALSKEEMVSDIKNPTCKTCKKPMNGWSRSIVNCEDCREKNRLKKKKKKEEEKKKKEIINNWYEGKKELIYIYSVVDSVRDWYLELMEEEHRISEEARLIGEEINTLSNCLKGIRRTYYCIFCVCMEHDNEDDWVDYILKRLDEEFMKDFNEFRKREKHLGVIVDYILKLHDDSMEKLIDLKLLEKEELETRVCDGSLR